MHNLDNEALRRRVDEGVRKQKRAMHVVFFVVSLFMFVLFVGISVAMLTSASLPRELVQGNNALVTGAFIMLVMGWLSTLAFQGINLLGELGIMDRSLRDRIITREISRQLYENTLQDYEKPKRSADSDSETTGTGSEDTQYALSDDG